jgi:hypothetical protein
MFLGGNPAPFGETAMMRASYEMARVPLYSTICIGLRETTQPLPSMEQVELQSVTPLCEIIGRVPCRCGVFGFDLVSATHDSCSYRHELK